MQTVYDKISFKSVEEEVQLDNAVSCLLTLFSNKSCLLHLYGMTNRSMQVGNLATLALLDSLENNTE